MKTDYLAQREENLIREDTYSLGLPKGRLVTEKEILFIEQNLRNINLGEDEFFPLPLCHLIHFNILPCDIYLDHNNNPDFIGQFYRVWPKGRVFSQTDVTTIEKYENSFCYVLCADVDQLLLTFLHFLEQNLFVSRMTSLDLIKLLIDLINLWIRNFFLNTCGHHSEQYHLGAKLMEKLCCLIEPMTRPYDLLMKLRQHGSGILAHCLNVSLISLAFIHFLGFTATMALLFGMGALLHDVGMVPFARHLISKEGYLSQEDIVEIKTHPHLGNNVMRKIVGIPQEVLLMVLQHHENMDGSGYPVGLRDGQIHPWARMLRVIDSYESITAPRPWRAPFTPDRALVIIKTAWKAKPDYDRRFLEFMILFLEAITDQ